MDRFDALSIAKHYLEELSRPGYENEALATQLQAAIDAEDQPRALDVLGDVMDHLQEVGGNHMMPPAAMGVPVFYQSTIRGVGNPEATKNLVYFTARPFASPPKPTAGPNTSDTNRGRRRC